MTYRFRCYDRDGTAYPNYVYSSFAGLKQISGKVEVAPAKGWKLRFIKTSNGRVKNGSRVKKGNTVVNVVLTNEKRGLTQSVVLSGAGGVL